MKMTRGDLQICNFISFSFDDGLHDTKHTHTCIDMNARSVTNLNWVGLMLILIVNQDQYLEFTYPPSRVNNEP